MYADANGNRHQVGENRFFILIFRCHTCQIEEELLEDNYKVQARLWKALENLKLGSASGLFVCAHGGSAYR